MVVLLLCHGIVFPSSNLSIYVHDYFNVMKPSPNVISAAINVIFNAEIFLLTISSEYTHTHTCDDKPMHSIVLFEINSNKNKANNSDITFAQIKAAMKRNFCTTLEETTLSIETIAKINEM